MSVTIQLPRSERQKLRNAARDMTQEVENKIKKAVLTTAYRVQSKAKHNIRNNGTTNTGRLTNSIGVKFDEFTLVARVGAEAHYAPYVEYGTAPHMPPIEPLKDWARLKLGDESAGYPVALKIAREGTDPQPFLEPAVEKEREDFISRLSQILMSLE